VATRHAAATARREDGTPRRPARTAASTRAPKDRDAVTAAATWVAIPTTGPPAPSEPPPTRPPAACARRAGTTASANKALDSGPCASPAPRDATSAMSPADAADKGALARLGRRHRQNARLRLACVGAIR